MARNRKKRRQQHGSAWHWKQTDSWYYTEPGTKKRVPLVDECGERIRGKECKETVEIALAKEKLTWEGERERVFLAAMANARRPRLLGVYPVLQARFGE